MGIPEFAQVFQLVLQVRNIGLGVCCQGVLQLLLGFFQPLLGLVCQSLLFVCGLFQRGGVLVSYRGLCLSGICQILGVVRFLLAVCCLRCGVAVGIGHAARSGEGGVTAGNHPVDGQVAGDFLYVDVLSGGGRQRTGAGIATGGIHPQGVFGGTDAAACGEDDLIRGNQRAVLCA